MNPHRKCQHSRQKQVALMTFFVNKGLNGTETTESYHYYDVIMGAIVCPITSLAIVYYTVYSDADQRKHQSSASLAFVRGIHRGPVNSPHKCPVTRKIFPFDDVIMLQTNMNESKSENQFWYNRLYQFIVPDIFVALSMVPRAFESDPVA